MVRAVEKSRVFLILRRSRIDRKQDLEKVAWYQLLIPTFSEHATEQLGTGRVGIGAIGCGLCSWSG